MEKERNKDRCVLTDRRLLPDRFEWGYIFFCFLIYLIWSVVFVVHTYGPDEYMRIIVPEYIARNHVLPDGSEAELINIYWGYSYALQMKLPYLAAGLTMRIAMIFSSEYFAALIAARLVNVIFMTGAVFYSIRLTHRVTDSPCRWIFIILISLSPQFIFMGSYFNLEAYSLLTVLMMIDAWGSGIDSNWDLKSCIYLGASMGLCILGYEYAYSFILASVVLYVFYYIRNRKEMSFGSFIRSGLVIVLFFLLVCGWYLVRNCILYNGDIFAVKIQDTYSELNAMDELKPSNRDTPMHQGMSVATMLKETVWYEWTVQSIYCTLGYMSIRLSEIYYRIYDIFLLAGCLSAVVLWRGSEKKKWSPVIIASLITGALVNVGLSVYASWARDFQPQGRYVIYAVIPLYMLVAFGWHLLSEKLRRFLKLHSAIPLMVFAFVTVTDIMSFILCLRVFYPEWGIY